MTPPSPEAQGRRWRSALAAGVLFTLAGPLVGMALAITPALVREPFPAHVDLQSTAFLFALAYFAGAPAALMTGVAAGAIAPDPRRPAAFAVALGVGAATAFAWPGSLAYRPSLGFHLLMAAIGAGAGLVCSLLRWARAAAWRRRHAVSPAA